MQTEKEEEMEYAADAGEVGNVNVNVNEKNVNKNVSVF